MPVSVETIRYNKKGKNIMPLQDEIYAEYGYERFTISDLLSRPCRTAAGRYTVGNKTFAEKTLRTFPYNISVSIDGLEKGNHVRGGLVPLLYRFGNATFRIIEIEDRLDAERQDCFGDSEGDSESILSDLGGEPTISIVDNSNSADLSLHQIVDAEYSRDPVSIVAHTIADTPFQSYFRRQRRYYPDPAVNGWSARLEAYFWPSFSNNWENTSPRIEQFSRRFQGIQNSRSNGNHETTDLLRLFEDICAWGGVKLPETDENLLFDEVFRTLEYIDDNTLPGNDSRLNSAWTKLYAIARPDSFVIYDSRVATALISILDPYMNDLVATDNVGEAVELGTVQGRGGTRPRVNTYRWPVGYKRWASQFAANNLCRLIVSYLNENDAINENRRWTLRKVEAVLFMEGY